MREYFKEEEVKELSPEEAKKVLAANDGKTIGDEAEEILQDTDSLPSYLQYNDAEDPEVMEEAYNQFNREGLGLRFTEAVSWIAEQIADYFEENGFDPSEEAFEDFKDNYYTTPEGKRPLTDKVLHERWDAAVYKAQRSGMSADDDNKPSYDPENPYEGMSDDAIQFAQLLNDFQDTELTAEQTAEAKYDQLANVTANIVMGESFKKHAFICGDAGVGKTYAINKISEELWPKSPLKKDGWTMVYNKGDIGQSVMPITAFFFEHRDKEIIVLDDADAFLKKNDDRVLNMLKGMLNTENTINNPEPVYIPASIRLSAAQYLKKPDISCTKTEQETNWQQGVYFKENVMQINAEKFREGIMELSMNGEVIYSGRLTESEKEHYGIITQEELTRKRESKNLLGMGYTKRLHEDVEPFYMGEGEEAPAEDIGDVENGDPEFGGGKNDKGKWFLPEQFIFTSRLIMISNLAPSMVNEAFKSRCDVVAITLTHDEFVAHLAKVVPGLMKDMETTIPKDLIDLIKNENYGYLKRLMELEGRPIAGRTVQINIPLQFRLIPEMCGKWLASAKAYCRKHSMNLTAENFRVVATAIEPIFVVNTLIPFLADTQYSGDPNRRRR